MTSRRAFLSMASTLLAAQAFAQEPPLRVDGGPFVPTPWDILDEMMRLADIRPEDHVFDLGSGDGRLVIEAAKRHGARGFGIEWDANLVRYATERAEKDMVGHRVRFVAGDLFGADLRDATVVMLYLLPRMLEKLTPKLKSDLPPGARIVSHDYRLTDWKPDKVLTFDVPEKERISGTTETTLLYYLVPAKIAGTWSLALSEPFGGDAPLRVTITQNGNEIDGAALVAEGNALPLRDPILRGDTIRFGLFYRGRLMSLSGRIGAGTMSGDVRARTDIGRWTATRS